MMALLMAALLLTPAVAAAGGSITFFKRSEVVGAEIVRAAGGEVRVLSLVDDCSTTAIVDRIQQKD